METHSLTFRAFKNIAYNIVGFFWPLAFTILITPIIVFKLGLREYGVYLFVTTALTFVGIIDLGLGTAFTKYMSFYYGKGNKEELNALAHSSNSVFLLTGLAGLLLVSLAILVGPHLLHDKLAGYQQYALLFFIGGLMFFLRSMSVTSNTILVAVQRFDILTHIGIAQITLFSLSMLLVVQLGGSLTGIFVSQLIITLGVTGYFMYQARRVMPVITYRFGWDTGKIKECLTFGLVNFFINMASSALSSLDKLIIPFYVGPSNLTYYNMGGSVGGKIPGFATSLSATLLPTVSQFSGGDDFSRIQTLYIRSFRLITIISAALTITAVSFAHQTLLFWLDADFAAKAANLLVILAFTNFLLALFGPLSNFLFGLGKLKFLSVASISMAVLNVIFLVLLLPRYGITGAAYAYLFSVLPIIYIFYYVEHHYLRLGQRREYYLRTAAGVLYTSIIMYAINLGLTKLVSSLPTLLIIGGTSFLLYIMTYKILGFFNPEDWRDLETFTEILLKKIGLK